MNEMKRYHRKKQHHLPSSLRGLLTSCEMVIDDDVRKKHYNQNYRIRKTRKPIVKPDLDLIMEEALNK